ncbi:uncharacterized transporter slc-17.2-like isoform X3 [Periplaneta americana]|uniref:uncharacterized transporter slc-17.2-like isoform X3 n=1 Tax=Periplaneta americana TaxID=6978 RepID=UPI0037E6FFDA
MDTIVHKFDAFHSRRIHLHWRSYRVFRIPQRQEKMAAFGKLKRGSVQLQRAAIKASGRIGARHVMVGMVVLGLVLSGFVERSATVALLALSDPLSSADFAEYVANTSYVTRYCSLNDTEQVDVEEQPQDLDEERDSSEFEEDESFAENETTPMGHGRHLVAEPPLKVPFSEEEDLDFRLREIFLWGTLFAPLPSSRLAAKAGPVRVFGIGVLGAGALAVLVPFGAWFSSYHIAIRFAQGLFTGSTWPALHMLAALWFPPLQRSGFISCYSAVSVGHATAGLLGTPLVLAMGRDSLCYLLAALTLLWALGWWLLVRDSPAEHPRLSAEQRHHLQRAIGPGVSARNTDRVLSVLPHLGHFLASLTFGRLVDHVRGEAIVSTTTARKLLVYISHFVPGAVLFVVGYSGCDPATPAALYTAAVVVSGATAAGAYSSAVDIAPNFAGTVFGLSQTFGAAGSLAASYVVTEGLHGSLPGSWRLVFGVAAFVLAVTATVFMAVGSGSVQPWNNLPPPEPEQQSEISVSASDAEEEEAGFTQEESAVEEVAAVDIAPASDVTSPATSTTTALVTTTV